MITQGRLKELFNYDAQTGLFTRRVTVNGGRWKAGEFVGHTAKDGYVHISVDGVLYKAHRLAWLYAYGEFPNHNIDHIKGMSNAIGNLRDATQSVNVQNIRRAKKNSKSGLLGAFWVPEKKKFVAKLCHQRKSIHLGYYKTAKEAHQAYLDAKRKLHEGCTI